MFHSLGRTGQHASHNSAALENCRVLIDGRVNFFSDVSSICLEDRRQKLTLFGATYFLGSLTSWIMILLYPKGNGERLKEALLGNSLWCMQGKAWTKKISQTLNQVPSPLLIRMWYWASHLASSNLWDSHPSLIKYGLCSLPPSISICGLNSVCLACSPGQAPNECSLPISRYFMY